ncbi:MAG: tetratricopeptide repeat protein [Actinobacteria bacterium]|nr:tetratricopeptide repeat protein [Actinomycetota bacterium]
MESNTLKTNIKRLTVIFLLTLILVVAFIIGYINYENTLKRQAIISEITKADRFLESGDFNQAAKSYRKVIELTGKEDPEILKKLATAEIGRRKRDNAEKLLKRIVQLNPKDAEAYFQLSLIFYERRETTEAIRFAEKAAALKATYIAPRYFLAKQYALISDYEKAIVKYEEIIKINPKIVSSEPQILKELANCYERSGKKEQAVFYYQQALSYLPGDPEINQALKRLSEGE